MLSGHQAKDTPTAVYNPNNPDNPNNPTNPYNPTNPNNPNNPNNPTNPNNPNNPNNPDNSDNPSNSNNPNPNNPNDPSRYGHNVSLWGRYKRKIDVPTVVGAGVAVRGKRLLQLETMGL
jgi:hypothetical protein